VSTSPPLPEPTGFITTTQIRQSAQEGTSLLTRMPGWMRRLPPARVLDVRAAMQARLRQADERIEALNAAITRVEVEREQLAITLTEILRGLDHPGRWPVGATEVGVWFALADVQRWRNVLDQHGGNINGDALRPTSPTGDTE
jgi:hypothetical protein